MSNDGHRWLMVTTGEPFVNESFTPAAPGTDEVTVEIAGCGVCHTDLGFFYDRVPTKHDLPLTLGHEISGRVVAAGKGADALLHKAVIIPAVIPCGHCESCQKGLGNICRAQKMPGNDIHGGFATHITVPAHGMCEVDESLLAEAGMALAELAVIADAVTTPYQAISMAGLQAGDLAIVIGVGGVGGYAVQIAHAMGATVVAIDIDQEKLEIISAHGAALTLNAGQHDNRDLKKQITEFTRQQDLPATEWKIFECSGTVAGQTTAFGLLTYAAHLAIVGFTLSKPELCLSRLMAFHARMQGNWGCIPEHYPAVLDLVLTNRIKMKPFIKQFPLDEINQVFESTHAHQLNERAILVP